MPCCRRSRRGRAVRADASAAGAGRGRLGGQVFFQDRDVQGVGHFALILVPVNGADDLAFYGDLDRPAGARRGIRPLYTSDAADE